MNRDNRISDHNPTKCKFLNCVNPPNCGAKPPYDVMCHTCYDDYMEMLRLEREYRKGKGYKY